MIRDHNHLLELLSIWDGHVDKSLTEEENITIIFNKANGTSFLPDNLIFGIPTITSDDLPPPSALNTTPLNLNTSISVKAAPGIDMEMVNPFNYRRVDVATQWNELNGNRRIELPSSSVTNDEVLAIVTEFMPHIAGSITTTLNNNIITIAAKENSYIYIGSTTVNAIIPKTFMDDLPVYLAGFKYEHAKSLKSEHFDY